MLTHIQIRDLATIAALELNLKTGSTMITGETGAGKSIFIEAIEIALGGRASANLVRPGKEKAEISLCFDITHFPKVTEQLAENDLNLDEPECIIRRVIGADGRSRCYVNGSPATLPLVKELGELLFHLHGQHEQQVLLKSETQREMLDRFADHLPLAATVKQLAEEWREIDQAIIKLQNKLSERNDRTEYLRFQLDELDQVGLKEGEWETLEAEHKRLSNSETLLRDIQIALSALSESDEQNALSCLNEVRKALDNVTSMEPKAQTWLQTLQSALIQLEDVEAEVRHYLEHTELDPERLQSIENRVSQLFNLARKHKLTPAQLLTYQTQLRDELASLAASDEDLEQLQAKLAKVHQSYHCEAQALGKKREVAAKKFAHIITTTIRGLSLPHGEFSIQLEPLTDDSVPNLHGLQRIHFLIKTNPDQTLQPLAKVVSGGELSRLSLAAHLALANRTSIPTLVFDEVDTGLSGATAEKIGKLLRKLGESYQVFCVTHQPQVAACGHHQLLVEKCFVDKTTHTRLRLLNEEERTAEIARMLGGEKITTKTLEHARETLESMQLAG